MAKQDTATTTKESVGVSKDAWVRSLSSQLELSLKDSALVYDAFVSTFHTFAVEHDRIPMPGIGTFEVRSYTAASVPPLTKAEKESGVTVQQKRNGAKIVSRQKVYFSMAAPVARLLNGTEDVEGTETAENQEAVA